MLCLFSSFMNLFCHVCICFLICTQESSQMTVQVVHYWPVSFPLHQLLDICVETSLKNTAKNALYNVRQLLCLSSSRGPAESLHCNYFQMRSEFLPKLLHFWCRKYLVWIRVVKILKSHTPSPAL